MSVPPSPNTLLLVAALTGMAVMLIELTAVRCLAPAFGTSLYVWTNVIGVVLGAAAVGSALGGRWADLAPRPDLLGRILLWAALVAIPAPLVAVHLGRWVLPEPTALSPFVATPHIVRGSLLGGLLFAPPIALLGAAGPFLVRLLADRGLGEGRAAGRTLAASTAGSLLGTALPALLLLEALGSRGTVLLGALILAVAAWILLTGALRHAALGTALVCLSGSLLVGRLTIAPTIAPIEGDAVREQELLEEIETPYQYVRISRWRTGAEADGTPRTQLRLSLDEGVTEFHSVLSEGEELTGLYYDAFALLPELFPDRGERGLDVLVLGGGAGTMARLLRLHHGPAIARVVNVELDPAVVSEASRFGWTPGPRDRDVVGDARVVLRALEHRFDLIILDAYARQIAIPPHLASREFFALVRSRLTTRGLLALNVSTPDMESPLCRALGRTLTAVFPKVAVVGVAGSWNALFVAMEDPARDLTIPRNRGDDVLTPIRHAWRRQLMPLPETAASGMLLEDDRAPMESLARKR